jgi:nucleoside-diphosphate-sugar epimerase
MNKRILITGSTGYIGKHLANRLLPLEDVDVYGFNRTYDSRLEARFSLEGSILDADLSTWLERARPEVIFHCSGYGGYSTYLAYPGIIHGTKSQVPHGAGTAI